MVSIECVLCRMCCAAVASANTYTLRESARALSPLSRARARSLSLSRARARSLPCARALSLSIRGLWFADTLRCRGY